MGIVDVSASRPSSFDSSGFNSREVPGYSEEFDASYGRQISYLQWRGKFLLSPPHHLEGFHVSDHVFDLRFFQRFLKGGMRRVAIFDPSFQVLVGNFVPNSR